jgi:hypothetical protein
MTTNATLSAATPSQAPSPVASTPTGIHLPTSNLRGAVLASRSNLREAKKRLMETDHPTRMGILSDQREPKDLSSDQIRKLKITPGPRAKKRLMETHPSSKFAPTDWDHSHLTFSNRNNKTLFAIHKPDSNGQVETTRNRRNSSKISEMTSSKRPKTSGPEPPPPSQFVPH